MLIIIRTIKTSRHKEDVYVIRTLPSPCQNNTYDPSIEFMLFIESPMLALLLKDLPDEKQKELWNDNNTDWIFQQKVDENKQSRLLLLKQVTGINLPHCL